MHHIVIFTTPGCRPCSAARAFLDEHHVAYEEVALSEEPAAWARFREAVRGPKGLPVLVVGHRVVHGFDRAAIEDALGLPRTPGVRFVATGPLPHGACALIGAPSAG